MKGLLLSHPTGNAFVRAALLGLVNAGILGEFHTSIASYPGNVWDLVGKTPLGQELKRRQYDASLRSFTVQHPFRELGRVLASRLELHRLNRHETGFFSIDAIYRTMDGIVAKRLRESPQEFTCVYAYEDGALDTFRIAHELGIRRFYDLPIAHWQTAQRLLHEEAGRLPAWEPTLGGTRDSPAKLSRKSKELEWAEVVICPSKFVADSLPATVRACQRIVIAPFGSPPSPPTRKSAPLANKKLRVLFAGSMTQRKGLGDLLAAMRMLNRNDVELVIMGSPQVAMEFYRNEFNGFTYETGRPHAQVLELMRSCDLFCLPSIVEGRALVMQEAMSQGLPLIITRNTGGEDLIDEGVTGFLVPIRRPDEIANRIAWFADNRVALPEMSRAAQVKAQQLTWESYAQIIVKSIVDSSHS